MKKPHAIAIEVDEFRGSPLLVCDQPARRSTWNVVGSVYFATDGTVSKIGFTTQRPEKRLEWLRSQTWPRLGIDLQLVAAFPAIRAVEARIRDFVRDDLIHRSELLGEDYGGYFVDYVHHGRAFVDAVHALGSLPDMPPIIDPTGLFSGTRLRRCSDKARLYWPYFFLGADGFGRLELDYALLVNRLFMAFDAPPSEEEVCQFFEEYRAHHLAFLYEGSGSLWCQWSVPDKYLPRYKSASDKKSPPPPAAEFERWQKSYAKQKKGLAAHFGNFPKSSEKFQKVSHVGVGVGVAVDVKEKSVRSSLHDARAFDPEPGLRRFEAEAKRLAPDRWVVHPTEFAWIEVVDSEAKQTEVFEGLEYWKGSRQWADGVFDRWDRWLTNLKFQQRPKLAGPVGVSAAEERRRRSLEAIQQA